MSLEEQFDRRFRPHGGRLKRQRVQPELMKVLDDWLQFFRGIIKGGQEGKEFITGDVYIDYVDNTSINAIATQVGRDEFIGLFLGATMFVYDAFVVLATYPSVFEGIGETNGTYEQDRIKKYLLRPDPRRFLDIGESIDRTRWTLAQSATMTAQFFLFGHEVGHLLYGHLRYLISKTGNTDFVEYPAAPLVSDALYERRILEFDADRHGAIVSLNWWGRLSENSGQDIRFGLNTFYLWGFSLGVLFRLMDLYTRAPQQEAALTHPMPDVRFAHAFVCGLEEVMTRFPNRVDEFKSEVGRAAKDLDDLWGSLDLPAPSFGNWRNNLGRDVAEYRRSWERLKDDYLDNLAQQRSDEIRARQ